MTHSAIPFDAISAGMVVRTTDDGHMLALDFLSTLTGNDRKKASQTLARINTRPETAALLTLRHAASGRKHARKMISFSNAIQLLLLLPKRTVCMDTRRHVAGILADHYGHRHHETSTRQRPPLSLDRISQCMELMERCGPLSEDEAARFRRAIAEHMAET